MSTLKKIFRLVNDGNIKFTLDREFYLLTRGII